MRGSIRQRGALFTAYWSTSDPATGQRVQHTKGSFRTQGAARKHLNVVMPKVDDGSYRVDKPLTVSQLLTEHWLPAQKSRELRPSTLDQYALAVNSWIVPHIGGVRVSALTPKQVTEWVDTLRTAKSSTGRKGLSPRVAQLSVGVLKAACGWAVENGLLSRNPIAGVRRPRAQSTVMKAWDTDQARAFLASTTTDRLSFAWSLLLTRGLRRGELCGLRWESVDLGAGVVRINRTRVVVDGKAIDSIPKTAAGRRSIPLDPSLVTILRAHKATQGREKLASGGAYDDGGYLLADELGHPYYPDSLSTWFDQKVKSSGLPRIRLHDTRHTAASLMLASGVGVKVVSEMLGHASPTITLAIYAHVLPGQSEAAGAALSASLLG
jgi:integrase